MDPVRAVQLGVGDPLSVRGNVRTYGDVRLQKPKRRSSLGVNDPNLSIEVGPEEMPTGEENSLSEWRARAIRRGPCVSLYAEVRPNTYGHACDEAECDKKSSRHRKLARPE